MQTRIQAHTPAPYTLTDTQVPPSAGSRQPGMGLCPTTNVHVQDSSGHFPHFLPGLTSNQELTLNQKWTPSLKGYPIALIKCRYSLSYQRENLGPPLGRKTGPLRPQARETVSSPPASEMPPSRLTVGSGDVPKEGDLGRSHDGSVGKGPCWLLSPPAAESVCACVSSRCSHRHPLFPLLTLLFEKCEQATQGSECITSASFDVDIENFVHQQEQEHKPFFSDDPELDNLVKTLQPHLG